MANKKIVLCKLNEYYCPTVEIHNDETVTIGEDDKVAVLTKDQWNMLVDNIREGKLEKI
ncbi:MAG: hypothetical protein HYT79_07415 [Elusimicrobia bacterium]|nr:hypothetical protein [Elusimicrobiota bacterium]